MSEPTGNLSPPRPSRRKFLVTGASVAALGVAGVACSSGAETSGGLAAEVEPTATATVGPIVPPTVAPAATPVPDPTAAPTAPPTAPALSDRQAEMVRRRVAAADVHARRPAPTLASNGDRELYPNGLGSFTKTLVHNELGEVEEADYQQLRQAIESGDLDLFDLVRAGGTAKLANPGAAHCYALVGADPQSIDMPAVHTLTSSRQGGEAIEVYWMALARDVSFAEFDSNEITGAAAVELSAHPDFTGPVADGQVTASTLFRGQTLGDLSGPYVSQFLWSDVPHGSYPLAQRAARPVPGNDFMVDYDEWLAVQSGAGPRGSAVLGGDERYISTIRDLAEYVHGDYTYQSYLNAALTCLSFGPAAVSRTPYTDRPRQGQFLTFGPADILDLVPRMAVAALRPAWFHKWVVHDKLRPEAFGGRLHNELTGAASYGLDSSITESEAVQRVFDKTGTYLLPQAYPEGSPTHPSYPAGHACIAGAGVTVLKALFEEDFELPDPVVASVDGSELALFEGRLTLGNELNKLASNIATGRNMAGVHWRADGDDGLVVGEEMALTALQDHLREVDADSSYQLTRFDGSSIVVTTEEVTEA